ncbi:MAG: outer membrane biogenesis protein BamB [candidate division BRC1 bacterium ADurb.BinA364]|nr:MAG: outer membrane biogenesis protein BamB [candidate division BRC1 bacterium ADurb.BinA364]
MNRRCLFAAVAITALAIPAVAGEFSWPQWRGADQTGVSLETGLLAAWPEAGPSVLWRMPLGSGFSSVAVEGGKAYTLYGTDKEEMCVCLDAATGRVVWKKRIGAIYKNSWGDGPRATPTIHQGKVYAFSGNGDLACLDAETGVEIWGANLLRKYGAQNLEWGMAGSPYIEGDMVVMNPGGSGGKSVVALDKNTGETIWTSLNDKAGYSTVVGIDVDGMRQLVIFTAEAVVGLAPGNGAELWRYPWKTRYDCNIATPIYRDNKLFISSNYGEGCALLGLNAHDGKATARTIYRNKNMNNHFNSSILVGDFLFGFDDATLACLDFETGETRWTQKGFNKGSVLAADGKLIVYGERAQLALAEASGEAYKEISRCQALDGKTWTVPTLCNGRLYVRNEKEIACLKIAP